MTPLLSSLAIALDQLDVVSNDVPDDATSLRFEFDRSAWVSPGTLEVELEISLDGGESWVSICKAVFTDQDDRTRPSSFTHSIPEGVGRLARWTRRVTGDVSAGYSISAL